MDEERTTKEQAILDAAENIFIKNGFNQAKTTDIATEAGVTHAMLHYYFRKKENLFELVFDKKIKLFANTFVNILDENCTFFEKIEAIIRNHFRLISENPKLPFFIYNEVRNNKERKNTLIKVFLSKAIPVYDYLQKIIDDEFAKGNIAHIKVLDLMINIVTLNVSIVLAMPFFDLETEQGKISYQAFTDSRLENNIEIILKNFRI